MLEGFEKIGGVDMAPLSHKVSKRTLYNWAKGGFYKEAFKKVGNNMYVNLERLIKLIEEENHGRPNL